MKYRKMTNNLSIALLVVSFISIWNSCCAPKKNIPKGQDQQCLTAGLVMDMKGLDGCTYLIVLQSGEKLLPAEVTDAGFQFKDGQQVRFDYEILPDMASICMVEDHIIKITCIKSIGENSGCVDTQKPMEVAWMQRIIKDNKIARVARHPKELNYLFENEYAFILMNCYGKILASGELGKLETDLKSKNLNLPDQVIWQGEKAND